MILEIVENQIFYYKNIITNPYQFIKKIEDLDAYIEQDFYLSKWSEWSASTDKNIIYGLKKEGSVYPKYIKNNYDKECLQVLNTIKKISDDCIENYVNKTNSKKVILPNYFSIRKYNTGADMGPHADSDDPTDKNHPYISGVLYLNDDYSGGEIEFPNYGISIKPEAGSMVIFPSYRPYVHHPKPPVFCNKYMSPFFWFKE